MPARDRVGTSVIAGGRCTAVKFRANSSDFSVGLSDCSWTVPNHTAGKSAPGPARRIVWTPGKRSRRTSNGISALCAAGKRARACRSTGISTNLARPSSPTNLNSTRGGTTAARGWKGTRKLRLALPGRHGTIQAVAFAPDGKTLASASTGGSVETRGVLEAAPQPRRPRKEAAGDLEALWAYVISADSVYGH